MKSFGVEVVEWWLSTCWGGGRSFRRVVWAWRRKDEMKRCHWPALPEPKRTEPPALRPHLNPSYLAIHGASGCEEAIYGDCQALGGVSMVPEGVRTFVSKGGMPECLPCGVVVECEDSEELYEEEK